MSTCRFCLGERVLSLPDSCCDECFESCGLGDAQLMVKAFHRKFGATIGETPAIRNHVLRRELTREEFEEFDDEIIADNLPKLCKEGCDLLYVVLGTFVAAGVDIWPIFQAVHASNMTKTADNKRADGKISKGDGYSPPDIEGCLRAQGWKP